MSDPPLLDEHTDPTALPAWQHLSTHARDLVRRRLYDLVSEDSKRFANFTVSGAGIEIDYSKQHVTRTTMDLLIELATESRLPDAIDALFTGALLNYTENRSAHHTRLRSNDRHDSEVNTVLQRVRSLACDIRSGMRRGYSGGPITDVVHIGIGGSVCGPELVFDVLREAPCQPRCHFVANLDEHNLGEVLRRLSPDTTLFIIVSKSFTTPETLLNAQRARSWFLERGGEPQMLGGHFMAVTGNVQRACAFGIDEQNVFPIWDWVGGRFSLWSAAGILTLAIALGWSQVQELLHGARAMDDHFRSQEMSSNLPLLLALLGVWNGNFLGATSHAVIPYAHRLRKLPEYLQQLEMESNGKSVSIDGSPSRVHTAPVVWGGTGTVSQHSFHQLLMQGTRRTGIDFIVPLANGEENTRAMLANCIAQSEALLRGRPTDECESELPPELSPSERGRLAKHQTIEGNRGSNLIMLENLSARSLGALIALYEHKVFCQGIIWRVNSFDQWGVELGKRLGHQLDQELNPAHPLLGSTHDPATAALVRHVRRNTPKPGSGEG